MSIKEKKNKTLRVKFTFSITIHHHLNITLAQKLKSHILNVTSIFKSNLEMSTDPFFPSSKKHKKTKFIKNHFLKGNVIFFVYFFFNLQAVCRLNIIGSILYKCTDLRINLICLTITHKMKCHYNREIIKKTVLIHCLV